MDKTRRLAQDLLGAVKKLNEEKGTKPIRHTEALKKLSIIFKITADQSSDDPILQEINLSTNPTAQAEIGKATRVHSHVTRNNTPNILLAIIPPAPQRVVEQHIPAPPPRVIPINNMPSENPRKWSYKRPCTSPQIQHEILNFPKRITKSPTVEYKMRDSIALLAAKEPDQPVNFPTHYCAPVIHPMTKEVITSYKKTCEGSNNEIPLGDGIWQRIWESGPRRQWYRREGHKFNMCYDTRGNKKHTQ